MCCVAWFYYCNIYKPIGCDSSLKRNTTRTTMLLWALKWHYILMCKWPFDMCCHGLHWGGHSSHNRQIHIQMQPIWMLLDCHTLTIRVIALLIKYGVRLHEINKAHKHWSCGGKGRDVLFCQPCISITAQTKLLQKDLGPMSNLLNWLTNFLSWHWWG